jgi:hypothetical protein
MRNEDAMHEERGRISEFRIYRFGGGILHAELSPASILMTNQLPAGDEGEASGSRNA